jgi:hypothetical protein
VKMSVLVRFMRQHWVPEPYQVPALVADVGPEATKRFFEFFTFPIRNKNTRTACYHAIGRFLVWCAFSSVSRGRIWTDTEALIALLDEVESRYQIDPGESLFDRAHHGRLRYLVSSL